MMTGEAGISFDKVFEQGGDIWAVIPGLSKELLKIELEGVDHGGIWIHDQKITERVLKATNQATLEARPVIFVPYSAIQYAVALAEGVSLSAEKLGL